MVGNRSSLLFTSPGVDCRPAMWQSVGGRQGIYVEDSVEDSKCCALNGILVSTVDDWRLFNRSRRPFWPWTRGLVTLVLGTLGEIPSKAAIVLDKLLEDLHMIAVGKADECTQYEVEEATVQHDEFMEQAENNASRCEVRTCTRVNGGKLRPAEKKSGRRRKCSGFSSSMCTYKDPPRQEEPPVREG
eukprot:962022-Pyramimonas_sp.AAC.2